MGLFRTTAPWWRNGKSRKRRGRSKGRIALPAAIAVRPRRAGKPQPWKLVGLAGIAGVAATGVVVARIRRSQRDVEPDELRERLHERLAEVGGEPSPPAPPVP